jgi:hypothetical protein
MDAVHLLRAQQQIRKRQREERVDRIDVRDIPVHCRRERDGLPIHRTPPSHWEPPASPRDAAPLMRTAERAPSCETATIDDFHG